MPAASSESGTVQLVLVCNPHSTVNLEIVRRARAEHANSRIVLVTGALSESELLQFIEAGVSAYVGTHESFAELLGAMHLTLENSSRYSGRVMRLVVENISRLAHHRQPRDVTRLTLREQEILSLVSQGFSNKEIAAQLSIAPNTVKHHVHNLLDKLQVKNRHQASSIDVSHLPRRALSS
jgi:DNA-binding NarL/FixJ family response regulator